MITKSVMKLVTDEVLHLIGKIQPLLIGLNAPERVQSCPVWFGRRLVEGARGRTWPRVGLLLGDIALLGAALHCLVASAMPP